MIERSIKDFNIDIWDYKNLDDKNLLHFAVRTGDIDIIKYFVPKGVDFKAIDNKSETTLEIARELGDTEVVEYFYAHDKVPLNQMDLPKESACEEIFS